MGKGKAKGAASAGKKAAAARTARVVEDKTFGLKNKKKSKKVQNYIAQVQKNASGGSFQSKEMQAAHAAKRKAEKLAQQQAEREMMALLGDSYVSKDKKKKKKAQKKKKAEQAQNEEERKAQEKLDFEMPIVPLQDVFRIESKADVPRVCAELTWKNNLTDKMKDGTENLFCRIDDGTTLNPLTLNLIGESASSCEFKVGQVLDIRGALAMVRGGKVDLEVVRSETCTIAVCSERLTEWVKEAKARAEEDRARGGVPIEELIEAQRAELRSDQLTPVTHERFLAWKEKKRKEKEAQWEKDRKAAQKKSGGKGLNVLTGRALFAYDSSLFKDDEDALADSEYDEVERALESEKTTPGAVGAGAAQERSAEVGATADSEDGLIIAAVDGAAIELQESLYLAGDDDDLDDLDDLDDDDEEEGGME